MGSCGDSPAVRSMRCATSGGLCVAVAVACCFPLALTQRSNITIKFIAEFVGRRIALYFDAAAALIVELVLILIARQFFMYAAALARSGDATTMLAIPTAPFWFVVSGVLGIAALTQCTVAVNQIWALTENAAP